MIFKTFTELISNINRDLGDFCNTFQAKRKELTQAGRVAQWGVLFGNVYDYLETDDYAYAINKGGTNEVQYQVFFDWASIRYGLGFNTQYVPFRGFTLEDMLPYMKAFLAKEKELSDSLTNYKFSLGKRSQLESPQIGQYTLWGNEIPVKKLEAGFQLLEEDYNTLLYDLSHGQFEAYKTIFKGRNNEIAERKIIDIRVMSEEIYSYLYAKYALNPFFYFLLRDNKSFEQLKDGYWFWGNNNELIISFWENKDLYEESYNIAFHVEKDGTCILRFCATDDEKKEKVLKAIASLIPNMKALKEDGVEIAIWEKRYEGKNYMANIQDFVEVRKPNIEVILSLAQSGITPINAESFIQNIERIENLRKTTEESEVIAKIENFASPHLLLKKLTVENIGIFSHLEIAFSERVTVLIGENGIGKTTILRAIALALAGVNENSLLDARHPKIETLLKVGTEKGESYLEYAFGNKPYRNRVLLTKVLYGVKVEDDTNSVFASIKNDSFPHLVIGFSQTQNSEIPFTVKRIPYQQLAAIKQAHVKDLLPLIYNQADNRFNAFTEWLIKLYNRGNQDLLNVPALGIAPQHRLINFIFSIISEVTDTPIFFKEVKLSIGKESEDVILIQDNSHPDGIPLNLISQGLNSIFSWVGYLMMRMYESAEERYDDVSEIKNEDGSSTTYKGYNFEYKFLSYALVFIDEIDTYLHPKWQRKILKVLVEKFPKTQFVVTTHSPLVATHLDEKAKVYSITKDKATLIQIAGRDISSALWDYFGVERREMLFQGKIDALFALLEQEPLPVEKIQADLQELKVVLGATDPDIQRAESIFEGLLWLEKEG